MKQINYIYTLIIILSYFSQSNSLLKQNNDFRYRFPVCNKYNCPRSRGICTRDNKCICLKNYITHTHFFLGNYILGFLKLIFTLITAFLVAVSPCLEENKMLSPNLTKTKNIMIIGYIIWQLFDGAMILFNIYKDSNGVPMNSTWA